MQLIIVCWFLYSTTLCWIHLLVLTVFWCSLQGFLHIRSYYLQQRLFYFFLSDLYVFFIFLPNCSFRTSSNMWVGVVRGAPCLIHDLRGKSFNLSTLIYYISLFKYVVFCIMWYIPSRSKFLRVFIMKSCHILSNAFTSSIDMII